MRGHMILCIHITGVSKQIASIPVYNPEILVDFNEG